ncbi:MAG: hypothetical protein JJ896_03970 [Rhodothermales bacterium]|nr:hypothetical protein [Rhodothermales bacterium]MBO6778793.1 hypothetical protein [Rhodothermales bacterium]
MGRSSRLAGTLLLALIGCDLASVRDASRDVQPLISADSTSIVIAGLVYDATSGEPVPGAGLRIGGEAAEAALDLFGKPVDRLVLEAGAGSFALANSVQPSRDRPFVVRLTAVAPGYRANAARLSVTDTGVTEFRIALDPENGSLASGFNFAIQVEGPLDDTLSVSHPSGFLNLRLPAGLAFGTEQSALLTASLALPSEALFSVFPGGMAAGVDSEEQGAASLTTGALVRLEGVPAFAGDSIAVRAVLDRNLLSPLTNEPIRNGDVVDVLEWQGSGGLWRREGSTRVQVTDGRLSARFHAKRPTTYSLGYFTTQCAPGRVSLRGNTVGGSVLAYRGIPGRADGQRIWRFGPEQEAVVLLDPPDFWRGQLQVMHGETILVQSYESLCDADLEIDLGAGVPPEPSTLTLEFGACAPLRVTGLPTLVGLLLPARTAPLTAVERSRQPPYVLQRPAVARDDIARVEALTLTTPGGVEAGSLVLALGGASARFPVGRGQQVVRTAEFGDALNLCS